MTRKTDDGGCDLFRRTSTQSEFALNDDLLRKRVKWATGPS